MDGKTVLITGATGGIGRATALGLARMGAHVAITGRDRGRLDTAAREIRSATGTSVDVFVGDVSSQADVRNLAAEVTQTLPRLDVLVNNVGGYWNHRHLTVDGVERTFAVNHVAPFLLTNLLIDLLQQSAPARVATVSSGAHSMGTMAFDDLMGEKSYSGSRAYNQSKLANVLFTNELARRLTGTGVTANALHPGVVRTAFGADDPGKMQRIFIPLARWFFKSPTAGAATSIYLASSPDVENVNGAYFVNCRRRNSAEASQDEDVAARLWRVTSELVASS
jgi:NAD(P)-dependent dehydrogenase (short-subunit alcohol dehydrogenase family)